MNELTYFQELMAPKNDVYFRIVFSLHETTHQLAIYMTFL